MDILEPDGRVVNPLLKALMIKCKTERIPIVICANSNAHCDLWGNDGTNHRGEILKDFIFQHDLTLQNVGNEPTFLGRDANTSIDITLTGGVDVSGWQVSREVTFSDHVLIKFNIALVAAFDKSR